MKRCEEDTSSLMEKKALEKKRNCCAALCNSIDNDLLVAKTFYFFFFAAFGSLFPLLAVYFKQLGMTATQSGILIGLRPFVEFCAAPMWGGFADKYRKAKVVMLLAVVAWIVFTEALAFVQPAAQSCVVTVENSNDTNTLTDDDNIVSLNLELSVRQTRTSETWNSGRRFPRDSENSTLFNKTVTPIALQDVLDANSLIKPPTSSIVYSEDDVRQVFLVLMMLVIVGEFFSAPAITLVDSATLGYLGLQRIEYYGRQRMFGSIGWGLAMLFVGLGLDLMEVIPDHPCGQLDESEKNYIICFGIYAVLMSCAFITATQLEFKYHCNDDDKQLTNYTHLADSSPEAANDGNIIEEATISGHIRKDEKLTEVVKPNNNTSKETESQELIACEQRNEVRNDDTDWVDVFRLFATVRYASVLYIAWFTGFCMGLLFTFLYWHLQDIGGTPTLFGICSIVNHISEVITYFISYKIIKVLGHITCLYIGLGCYTVRFLYISFLVEPWFVLPAEMLQGVTHALVWASLTSYIGQAVSPNLRSSAQGILQGIHHGLGRGCGAILGGILVHQVGTETTFRAVGASSLAILVFFGYIQWMIKAPSDEENELSQKLVSDSAPVAPAGVPADPFQPTLETKDGVLGHYGSILDNGISDAETEHSLFTTIKTLFRTRKKAVAKELEFKDINKLGF
uniref:Major facilitator superfamily domain-containing protein 6-like n=1 Tax=Saccoglossus kowalevskii TaxID=10224 RepID=A0ABM0GPZ9_SACKO|nr:PREDICTED: major facilitator superfamily domain-containing protein 6-like [Saccoglossus kowalevskii]